MANLEEIAGNFARHVINDDKDFNDMSEELKSEYIKCEEDYAMDFLQWLTKDYDITPKS